jgi:dTDP-4-amino-4,6-dideoxygalactose transaminase
MECPPWCHCFELTLPHVPDWAEPVWHLYVVQHPLRDALQQALTEAGVGTLIHYPIPPHRQQAYAQAGWAAGTFPLAERMAEQVLSLPIGPHLATGQVDASIAAVQEAAGRF